MASILLNQWSLSRPQLIAFDIGDHFLHLEVLSSLTMIKVWIIVQQIFSRFHWVDYVFLPLPFNIVFGWHTVANGILANLVWAEALNVLQWCKQRPPKLIGFGLAFVPHLSTMGSSDGCCLLILGSSMNTHGTDFSSVCNLKQSYSAEHSLGQLNCNQPANLWV